MHVLVGALAQQAVGHRSPRRVVVVIPAATRPGTRARHDGRCLFAGAGSQAGGSGEAHPPPSEWLRAVSRGPGRHAEDDLNPIDGARARPAGVLQARNGEHVAGGRHGEGCVTLIADGHGLAPCASPGTRLRWATWAVL